VNKGDEIKNASVYAVASSKEELYNYVLSTDGQNLYTLRLANVKSVSLLTKKAEIPEDIKQIFDRQIRCGAQYPIFKNETDLIKVILSQKGKYLFKKIYLYRPTPVKIENDAECTAITSEGVTVRNADAREYTLLADTVIWAGGYLPMEDEAEQFRTLAYDFWKIGDCAQGRIQCRLKYLNSILRYRESAVILLNLLLSYDKAPGSIYFRVPYRFSVPIVPPSAAGWRRGLAHLASLF